MDNISDTKISYFFFWWKIRLAK